MIDQPRRRSPVGNDAENHRRIRLLTRKLEPCVVRVLLHLDALAALEGGAVDKGHVGTRTVGRMNAAIAAVLELEMESRQEDIVAHPEVLELVDRSMWWDRRGA